MHADSLIVLDYETTGLSPDQGDRAIEIGAVKLQNGKVVERFQALMNPGRRISGFIESYTGITNAMLAEAEPCEKVMEKFADFIEGADLVAHNASFDRRFLEAELARVGRNVQGRFLCSLLLARRLYPEAENHKLGTLTRYKNIATDGDFHRALFDSEMTAKLWLSMLWDIQQQTSLDAIEVATLVKLSKTPKRNVANFLAKLAVN